MAREYKLHLLQQEKWARVVLVAAAWAEVPAHPTKSQLEYECNVNWCSALVKYKFGSLDSALKPNAIFSFPQK